MRKPYRKWPWNAASAPSGFWKEEFQKLAVALMNRVAAGPSKGIVFSAAHHGEGTSTVMLAVARELQSSLAVNPLVVELNRIQPVFEEVFKLDSERSVRAIAAGDRTVRECVQKEPGGLSVIPAGGDWPGARTGRISGRVLAEIGREYDLVLFDAPAVLESSDVLSADMRVNRMLLVVKAASTPIPVLNQVKRSVESQGIQILGSVLAVHNGDVPNWLYP
jgi:Mrp family chromosome partitioning ATPase